MSEELMTAEQVASYFQQGYMCSQVVLSAYAAQYGLDSEDALRVSAGFGGGMFNGHTCGAMTGAIMAIGLKYGMVAPDDREQSQQCMEKVDWFNKRMVDEFGSTMCKDLIKYDFAKPEDRLAARESGIMMDFCPKLVVTVIRTLGEIL